MKKKRAKLTSLLVLLVSLVCIASVFAHPGRTDSNGGHWDRQNGTYHFHTGEYAGRGSSGSSSNSEYAPFTPPYEPPTDNPNRKDKSNNKGNSKSDDFWGYAIISIFVLFYGWSIVRVFYDIFIYDHLPKRKIERLIDKISDYCSQQKEIYDIKLKFLIRPWINIPTSYEIGADNLPRDKNSSSNWGNSFTMYKTSQGKKLHPRYNCCYATIPVHICRYLPHYDLSDLLCSKCAWTYTLPNLSWYEEYLDCQRMKERWESKENRCRDLRKEIEMLHKKCNSATTKFLIMFSKRSRSALNEANTLYIEMQSKYKNGV